MKDLKGFIEKTVEDTIGFLQVHVRMLEALKRSTESEERAAGIQDAIDLINESCDKGQETADDYINRRGKLLQKKMQNETEEHGMAPVEACGPMDKKLD